VHDFLNDNKALFKGKNTQKFGNFGNQSSIDNCKDLTGHRKPFICTAMYFLKKVELKRGINMRDRHLNSWDSRVQLF
jgi:hypothetical protein